ncbi:MAG: hypothetical protein ACHQ6T_15585, partial [Myxococcota bacterium]
LSTTSLTTVGTLSITAVYSGDANDAGSTTASPFIETVAVPPPVPALPGAGGWLLGAALLLMVLGARVTIYAR